ncbi:hypothetical protein [Massilia sp. CF038]|uniref:hypothetical protein n=1 Tax=Massilia sp. CF038 TaxID=1881045 RepID=UPI0009228D75|nr:hypothetical protein [Massilia sp. CF038]SHH17976.1 hypothetical protein SAMN05428948_3176 [Massilia sp. CF038]
MNNKYIAYAVVLTIAITIINWYSFLSTARSSGGRGSGWSSHSSSGWGGGSGGGHK